MPQHFDSETLVDYLLGRLPEQEREDLEDCYLSDDDLHEQLLATEQELIDAYVNGTLATTNHTAFEQHFLTSPDRRRSIEFAEAFAANNRRFWERQPRPSFAHILLPRWFRIRSLALGALAILLMCGVAMLLMLRRTAPPASSQSAKLGSVRRNAPALPPHPVEGSGSSGGAVESPAAHDVIPAFILTPSARGSERIMIVAIPPRADRIRLILNAGTRTYGEYEAFVATADGRSVSRQIVARKRTAAGGATVAVTIRSELLRPGDYVAKISGVLPGGALEIISGYTFRVRARSGGEELSK